MYLAIFKNIMLVNIGLSWTRAFQVQRSGYIKTLIERNAWCLLDTSGRPGLERVALMKC